MAQSTPIPQWLRYSEAAEHYPLSASTWGRLARTGQIPCRKIGKRVVLLSRDDIERFLGGAA